MPYVFIVLFVIAVFLFVKCVRMVPQAQAWVVEFLGSYHATLRNGLHFTIPILQRVVRKVSMKEQVEDFPPQPVITKDNVTMQIDTVVYFCIFDPKLFTYGVEDPIMALANLTATTLRNIVGELELDETLTSRDTINTKMQATLDPATDKWGIRVNRVELKNIIPPKDIQEAMEKQMKAEREKRQTLLEAEAHREAAVTKAEGDKAAMVLRAQAESEAAITKARGEAEGIRLVYEAKAVGMERLSGVEMSQGAILVKKLEALQALGDGQATKIVVPTDLASQVGQLSIIGETLNITHDVDHSPRVQHPLPQPDSCCEQPGRSQVTRQMAADEQARQSRPVQRPAGQTASQTVPSDMDFGPAQGQAGQSSQGGRQRVWPSSVNTRKEGQGSGLAGRQEGTVSTRHQ